MFENNCLGSNSCFLNSDSFFIHALDGTADAVLAAQLALDRAGAFGFPILGFSPQNIEAFSFDKTQHDLEAEVIVDSAAN